MKTKKQQRITENIFDIMLNTPFKGEAEKQMRRDLYSTNVTCDKAKGEIVICSYETDKPLYKITVEKL